MATFFQRHKRRIAIGVACATVLGGLGGLGITALMSASLLLGGIIGASSLFLVSLFIVGIAYCCRSDDTDEHEFESLSMTDQWNRRPQVHSYHSEQKEHLSHENDPTHFRTHMEAILSELWGSRPKDKTLERSQTIPTIYATLQKFLHDISDQEQSSTEAACKLKLRTFRETAEKIRQTDFQEWLIAVCKVFGISMRMLQKDEWEKTYRGALNKCQQDPHSSCILDSVNIPPNQIVVFHYSNSTLLYQDDFLMRILERYNTDKRNEPKPIPPIPAPPSHPHVSPKNDPNFSSLAPKPHVPSSQLDINTIQIKSKKAIEAILEGSQHQILCTLLPLSFLERIIKKQELANRENLLRELEDLAQTQPVNVKDRLLKLFDICGCPYTLVEKEEWSSGWEDKVAITTRHYSFPDLLDNEVVLFIPLLTELMNGGIAGFNKSETVYNHFSKQLSQPQKQATPELTGNTITL